MLWSNFWTDLKISQAEKCHIQFVVTLLGTGSLKYETGAGPQGEFGFFSVKFSSEL